MGEKIMEGFPSSEDALKDLFEIWNPKPDVDIVTLDEAVGRVLANNVVARNTLPVVRSSQFDGIAVHSADFTCGIPDTCKWQSGIDYVRADTGDDFDDAFDAVVMIEKAAIQPDESVVFDEDVKVEPGSGVNPAGATLTEGTPIMEAGVPIRPTDIAALAMAGETMVKVRRKPRVAFIPTGNELVPAGFTPQRGQNVDTNSLMVKHLLIQYGAEPQLFPIVKDDPAELERAFEAAMESADIIVINGGSAIGEDDYNVRMISARGQVIHHYIAAVPGRPLMMAIVDGKPVIDLPGPTLAAYYGSEWCLQALVTRYLGIPMHKHPTVTASLEEDFSSIPIMANIGRWDIRRKGDGSYSAKAYNFKAGQLSQCMVSNAHRISPINEKGFPAGTELEFELLRGTEYISEV